MLRPEPSEPLIACYRDGVVLERRGTEKHVGKGWLAVTTPDGKPA